MTTDFKKAPVAYTLLALTLLSFLAMQAYVLTGTSLNLALFDFGAMFGNYVKTSPLQLYRLITPIFIHVDWQHLLFNGLTLYMLGQMAEQIWGSRKFLLLYLLAGIMGNAFAFYFSPASLVAGASGSLFGLFAAVSLLGRQSKNPQFQALGTSYRNLIIINLVFNIFTPGVSLVAHLGGLVGGALACLFLAPQFGPNPWKDNQARAGQFAYVALLALLLMLGFR